MVHLICLTYCFFFSVIAAFDFIYLFKFKCFILIPRYPLPSINSTINYHNPTYGYCEQSDAYHKIIINSRTTLLRLSWLTHCDFQLRLSHYIPTYNTHSFCYLNLTFVFFSALIVHCHIHMILRHEKIPCRINDSIILLIHLSM